MINLREIRKSSGLTQKELASMLGLSDCTIAHYESGMRKITLEMFLKVLEVCQIEMKLESKKNATKVDIS